MWQSWALTTPLDPPAIAYQAGKPEVWMRPWPETRVRAPDPPAQSLPSGWQL